MYTFLNEAEEMNKMVKMHDRYLIYSLLGRMVEVKLPMRQGGKRLKGTVEKVCRDIFSNQINVTINRQKYTFNEPSAIIDNEDEIHFLYGDTADMEEEQAVPAYNAYDESLHEHLARTERAPISKTVIVVGDLKRTPRNRWRSRVAV
jgi:hypothetical protein